MPVLFITGDEDWVFPPAAGPALAPLARDARAVRVPAAGHSVYFERAARFNQLLEEFL
jgi:pimeloyl-ACP methyl ester carboxylesterase